MKEIRIQRSWGEAISHVAETWAEFLAEVARLGGSTSVHFGDGGNEPQGRYPYNAVRYAYGMADDGVATAEGPKAERVAKMAIGMKFGAEFDRGEVRFLVSPLMPVGSYEEAVSLLTAIEAAGGEFNDSPAKIERCRAEKAAALANGEW